MFSAVLGMESTPYRAYETVDEAPAGGRFIDRIEGHHSGQGAALALPWNSKRRG